MIDRFMDEYRWLSNFWMTPVTFEGVTYPSVENAYQAAKTAPAHRSEFVTCTSGQAKRLGRRVPMREEWENIKLDVMYELNLQKFTSNEALRKALLNTGDEELVEGNNWGDVFWGKVNGQGENHLGKILMRVRAELHP